MKHAIYPAFFVLQKDHVHTFKHYKKYNKKITAPYSNSCYSMFLLLFPLKHMDQEASK